MKVRTLTRCLLIISTVGFICGLLTLKAEAIEATVEGITLQFHGFIEASAIVRDTKGFQNNIDHLKVIQQRNTLKFDLDILPSQFKWGGVTLEKVHLTYRGAYDSIFDLDSNQYQGISNDRHGRFNIGKDDIRFENVLREAFLDITYLGPPGNVLLRPGKQMVSWGTTSAVTLLDVINPPDNSFQMFFLNPDDLKQMLWMARLNYTPPQFLPGFNMNFELLFTPDIRPNQFAPLDGVYGNPNVGFDAPYAFGFKGFRGLNVREDVPTDKKEYGMKVGLEVGRNLTVNLVYFRDVHNDPAIKMTDFNAFGPTTATFSHPSQHLYGGYFFYHFIPSPALSAFDFIFRGEFARSNASIINLPGTMPDVILGGPAGVFEARMFRLKPTTSWMLGFDKSLWLRWLTKEGMVGFTFEWVHKTVNAWEPILNFEGTTTPQKSDLLTFIANWSWWNGRISPTLFVVYDIEGTVMVQPSVSYTISKHWYAKVAAQMFFGDRKANSGFAGVINTSEVTFRLGYQW